MNLRCLSISAPIEAVENHLPIVVELWQFVAIKYQTIFAIADDFHICFENLSREVFAEHKIYVVLKTVSFAKFDIFELLFELAKQNHTRRLASLFRFFDEHLRAEVHKLSRTKVLIGVEKLFASLIGFAIFIVPINVPRRVTCVCVNTQIIGGGSAMINCAFGMP